MNGKFLAKHRQLYGSPKFRHVPNSGERKLRPAEMIPADPLRRVEQMIAYAQAREDLALENHPDEEYSEIFPENYDRDALPISDAEQAEYAAQARREYREGFLQTLKKRRAKKPTPPEVSPKESAPPEDLSSQKPVDAPNKKSKKPAEGE